MEYVPDLTGIPENSRSKYNHMLLITLALAGVSCFSCILPLDVRYSVIILPGGCDVAIPTRKLNPGAVGRMKRPLEVN
jgi:hypothetical protein